MIGTIIGLIFVCIILGVCWWAAQQLIALIPLAEPFQTIVRVLIILVGVLIVLWILIWILGATGIHVNMPKFG